MPCLRHRSLADSPAACSFNTLMICSSVNLPLRIVCLLGGEQNPNSKPGAFQGSRSTACALRLHAASAHSAVSQVRSISSELARDGATHLSLAFLSRHHHSDQDTKRRPT